MSFSMPWLTDFALPEKPGPFWAPKCKDIVKVDLTTASCQNSIHLMLRSHWRQLQPPD